MGYYKVDFGTYSLCCSDSCKYLNYFEFNAQQYPIGAYVKLTNRGMSEAFRNRGYNFVQDGCRLVSHYTTESGKEMWEYIIGHMHNSTTPIIHSTCTKPDEFVSEVVWSGVHTTIQNPGELEVTFKEPNYSPKDWEVEGVMAGWIVMVLIWVAALALKDWWIVLLIQIGAGLYFGSWRENKINEAISTQKFKE